jgi:TPR repeat protein
MELIAYAPQYEWLYFRAAGNASNPIDESLRTQRFAQLQSLADANALSAVHRITLDQALEAHVNPPGKNPNPQAWRPYWEARAKAAPTIYNYVGWLESEYKVGNWSSMIELADKILALHPHHKRAFELKSHALREMGQSEQAYAAAFSAMMVGSDWAGNQLIQAYARGGLGVMHKDFEAMYAVCKLGANLGLAGAANCMGSAHSEGFAGVERDDKKALAWHLLGARAGNANSAHDVVVLMPRSVASPSHAAEVDALTGFWVRHAAGQGHTAAKNKLLARPEWGKPCPAIEEKAWMEMLLRTLIEVLR